MLSLVTGKYVDAPTTGRHHCESERDPATDRREVGTDDDLWMKQNSIFGKYFQSTQTGFEYFCGEIYWWNQNSNFCPVQKQKTMEAIYLCFFWIFIQNPWFFATISLKRLNIFKCRLRRYLNVYFRWVWKVSLDAFVFCENTFCVEIKAEYILKQNETHLAF